MFSKFKVSGPNEKRGGVWLVDDLTTYKDGFLDLSLSNLSPVPELVVNILCLLFQAF